MLSRAPVERGPWGSHSGCEQTRGRPEDLMFAPMIMTRRIVVRTIRSFHQVAMWQDLRANPQSAIPDPTILNQQSPIQRSSINNPQSSDPQSSIPQSTISDPQSAIFNPQLPSPPPPPSSSSKP